MPRRWGSPQAKGHASLSPGDEVRVWQRREAPSFALQAVAVVCVGETVNPWGERLAETRGEVWYGESHGLPNRVGELAGRRSRCFGTGEVASLDHRSDNNGCCERLMYCRRITGSDLGVECLCTTARDVDIHPNHVQWCIGLHWKVREQDGDDAGAGGMTHNYQGNRRRSPPGRRAQPRAMRMPKAWPLVASALTSGFMRVKSSNVEIQPTSQRSWRRSAAMNG